MKNPAPLLLLTLGLLFGDGAFAENSLEVYRLSYRTAEELLPLIRPHLPAGANLTGKGDTLVLKAAPGVAAEVEDLLRELDVAPRGVLIQVRVDGGASVEERAIGGDGRIGTHGGSGTVRIYRSQGAVADNRQQQVRALEGRPAFIATSLLLPVQDRAVFGGKQSGVVERTRFLTLSRGFYAIARIQGDWVEIDIASADDQAGPSGGARINRLETTVSGRLGEWLAIGGTSHDTRRDDGGVAYRSRDVGHDQRQVWLKVDLLEGR